MYRAMYSTKLLIDQIQELSDGAERNKIKKRCTVVAQQNYVHVLDLVLTE